ncbi:MAG: hypothetical protein NTU44_18315 [Bacteroidetes bacterium]|nr:hypothetical protein [Bacteroidota bacterium]
MAEGSKNRLLWGALLLLLLLNIFTGFFLLRRSPDTEIQQIEKVSHRLDSLAGNLSLSQKTIDSVIHTINSSLELTQKLDAQVKMLSSEYEKNSRSSRRKIEILKDQLKKEEDKLRVLQKELNKL